jgi:hypothetical protein
MSELQPNDPVSFRLATDQLRRQIDEAHRDIDAHHQADSERLGRLEGRLSEMEERLIGEAEAANLQAIQEALKASAI